MSFFFISCLYCCLQISQIVQTVKNTNNIDSVGNRFLYKILYHIICIGTITKNVLSSEQHLELCIFESITEFTKSFPWVFFQETQGSIKGSAAPAFYRMITHFIQFIHDRHHLFCCHSGGNQRLMSVTQDRLSNLNRFFYYFCHLFFLHLYFHVRRCGFYYTPKIAIKVPAATAVPITPATFGPMACISRKLVGSASAPTF